MTKITKFKVGDRVIVNVKKALVTKLADGSYRHTLTGGVCSKRITCIKKVKGVVFETFGDAPVFYKYELTDGTGYWLEGSLEKYPSEVVFKKEK